MISKQFLTALPLLLCGLVTSTPARAADLDILNDHPEGCHAMLSGQIVDGDTDRLRSLIPPGQTPFDRALQTVVLCLDSPGGSFPEGLKMAAYIRETGLSTHVAAGDSCLSACALTFLGGTQFWIEDGLTRNRSRSMHAAAILGFHAPQLDVPQGRFAETAVRQAFDVAIRASAEIFGGLEELRITRPFALSFFDVAGGDFYYIDRPERARELGVTLTGITNLPDRIDGARIKEICTAEFPSMGPAPYRDPNGGTAFVGDWVRDLAPGGNGVQRRAYLSGTTAEGTLMIEACVVEWRPPSAITLRHFRDISTDRGTWDNPQPPSARMLENQISASPTGYARALPALAAPIGTTLADLADTRPGVTNRRTAENTCAPIARSYRVMGVKNFSNMRAKPGFGEPVVSEVRKDRTVTPLDRSLDGAAILSPDCQSACRPAQQGVLTPDTLAGINRCSGSNDVWWKVRTQTGTEGWMSSKFLSP